MVLKVVVHEAEEGGYWAEVPALPGCFTQGATLAEVRERAEEVIRAYLEENDAQPDKEPIQILEIAV